MRLIAAAILAAVLALPARAGWGDLAGSVASAALGRGYNRVVIEPFEAHDGESAEAAVKAQAAFSTALFSLGRVAVMDAAALERVGPRGRAWAEVAVSGGLYPGEKGSELVLKVSDRRGGGGLLSLQEMLPAAPGGADYRDSPNSPGGCGALLAGLGEWNRARVDLKARYWAAKMRSPGFSYSALKTAPGGELSDYSVRQEFYARVNEYYRQDAPVRLEDGESARVEEFMRREEGVLGRCRPR